MDSQLCTQSVHINVTVMINTDFLLSKISRSPQYEKAVAENMQHLSLILSNIHSGFTAFRHSSAYLTKIGHAKENYSSVIFWTTPRNMIAET